MFPDNVMLIGYLLFEAILCGIPISQSLPDPSLSQTSQSSSPTQMLHQNSSIFSFQLASIIDYSITNHKQLSDKGVSCDFIKPTPVTTYWANASLGMAAGEGIMDVRWLSDKELYVLTTTGWLVKVERVGGRYVRLVERQLGDEQWRFAAASPQVMVIFCDKMILRVTQTAPFKLQEVLTNQDFQILHVQAATELGKMFILTSKMVLEWSLDTNLMKRLGGPVKSIFFNEANLYMLQPNRILIWHTNEKTFQDYSFPDHTTGLEMHNLIAIGDTITILLEHKKHRRIFELFRRNGDVFTNKLIHTSHNANSIVNVGEFTIVVFHKSLLLYPHSVHRNITAANSEYKMEFSQRIVKVIKVQADKLMIVFNQSIKIIQVGELMAPKISCVETSPIDIDMGLTFIKAEWNGTSRSYTEISTRKQVIFVDYDSWKLSAFMLIVSLLTGIGLTILFLFVVFIISKRILLKEKLIYMKRKELNQKRSRLTTDQDLVTGKEDFHSTLSQPAN